MVQVKPDVPPAPVDGQGPSTIDQAAGEGASLGKHEELSPRGCTCGPAHLRLTSDQGQIVKPRGGCVNKCDYCAKLQAVENCEMLVMDALEGDAPQLVAILGTRTATVDMDEFAQGRKEVVRAVRRHWPDAQYAYEVEFTTGYGPRSGGLRRPHWNWFWKGIPSCDEQTFADVVIETWCRYVDAEPDAQYAAAIRNEVGLTKYVTEHFMKASQRPPEGFTGQRFCASRGYFRGTTVQVARARARESLRVKRELWKAEQQGFGPHDQQLIAHQALELAYATVWTLTNDRGARVGPIAHDRGRQLLTMTSTEWRAWFDLVAAFDWRNLVPGDRNPGQPTTGAAEGPSVAQEQLRLADQPGGGEGTSPVLVEPPKPPGVLIVPTTDREGVSNGVGAMSERDRAPHAGDGRGNGQVAEQPEERQAALSLPGRHDR